jgi:hypothetical protein
MDRIVSSFLATHRQATLGTATLFDVLGWSNSRWKSPKTETLPSAQQEQPPPLKTSAAGGSR